MLFMIISIFTSFSGAVTYLGQTYHYQTQVTLADPLDGFNGDYDFSLEVTMASQIIFVLETNCKINYHDTATKVHFAIMYKSAQKNMYKITSFFSMDMSENPLSYKVDTEVSLSTPTLKDARIQSRLKFKNSPIHRNMDVQVRLRSLIGMYFNITIRMM